MMAIFRNQPWAIELIDEIIEVVTGFQNDVSASAPVASAWTTLGPVRFANERDGALSSVPGPRVDLDFVDKHPGKKLMLKWKFETHEIQRSQVQGM
jgi:hypothetical protein